MKTQNVTDFDTVDLFHIQTKARKLRADYLASILGLKRR